MSKVIGIDFDNTIACYDEVFSKVSNLLNFINSNDFTKSEIKSRLLKKKMAKSIGKYFKAKFMGNTCIKQKFFMAYMNFYC